MVKEIYKYYFTCNYMMEKNGAIGLSVETLVIIIISLVILASGITLIYQFISGAEEIKSDLDQKTQEELERLLVNQGQKVALPLHTATLYRGENHVFGLGILNTLDITENFYITVRLEKVADSAENDITAQVDTAEAAGWVFYDSGALPLESNGNRKEALLVQVPKEAIKGRYIFVATVSRSDKTTYGNPQTFIVTVV